MLEYPTISHQPRHVVVYAFDKLDGSNLRCEWTAKRGFSKFGSRTNLIGGDHWLSEAIDIFLAKYQESLDKIFRKNRWQRVTCFSEFWGPNSFAGNHAVEPHNVVLFDVAADKHGLIEPRRFLDLFGDLDVCRLLYHGNCNQIFINQIKNGSFPGMTFEGVVCKFVQKKRVEMFKIKNQAWIDRLHEKCGNDEEKFKMLV